VRALVVLLALGAALAPAARAQDTPPTESSCVTHCHGEQATEFKDCIHESELRCVDCHGGNPAATRDKEKSHDPEMGYRGKVPREQIPALCGSCHSDPLKMHAYGLPTDQLEHYRTSNHGKALFEKGDTSAAVCTDCHGTHRILPAHDPRSPTSPAAQPRTCGLCHSDAKRMEPHGLPSDIVAQFTGSVHGRALIVDGLRGAPACADCHGAHGATPPGVQDIVQVCGRCHTNTAEHFRKSPHFGSEEMQCSACHDEDTPEYRRSGCTACHGVHAIDEPTVQMFQGDEVGHCGHCHREPDGAEAVAKAIVDGTKELEGAVKESLREIQEAKQRGVFLDNEKIYLRESERTLVSVWPLSHSLDAAAIREHLAGGLKRQDRARELIAKRTIALRDRKLVLTAVAALLLLLIGLLRMKLKAIRELS